jgi:hypothetical protein
MRKTNRKLKSVPHNRGHRRTRREALFSASGSPKFSDEIDEQDRCAGNQELDAKSRDEEGVVFVEVIRLVTSSVGKIGRITPGRQE